MFKLVALAAVSATVLSACSSGGLGATVKRAAFTSSEYGVAVSERVTMNPNPPKGGGRYLVGRPYTVRGKTYHPAENPNYAASGNASWYGSDFHGRRTANGEIFSANAITAAHPTLPLPSYVRVTNQANGRSVIVRVNDRGPYVAGRIIDLSHRAASMLGYVNQGSASVAVEYVGQAPLEGDDTRMLVASYSGPAIPNGSSTRVASAGDHTVVGMATNFVTGIFSYSASAPDASLSEAHEAANLLATGAAIATGPDFSPANIGIGRFTNPEQAMMIAQEFALLGAVSEEPVQTSEGSMVKLRLTALKPGVDQQDVIDMGHLLGLGDVVLY
jgi:rare lipoprotein A